MKRIRFSLAALAATISWMIGAMGNAQAQTPHLFGIHDDVFPGVNTYLGLLPSGTGWITATDALGANPSDMGTKNYNPPSGTTIIGRLNYGYFPQGTLPPQAQYANFAQRVQNFVAGSSGCNTWVIANETNLAAEWPQVGGTLETVTPENYAAAYKLCHAAIKAVRPNDVVIPQALAPWAGPYGTGNLGGFTHAAMNDPWVDYYYKMMVAITTGPGAVTPDGLAMHINTRGYSAGGFNASPINVNTLTLDFSWGVYRDWLQYGVPRELWNLPVYATECNGLYYWKGGGPESVGDPTYQAGWMQRIYSDIHAWNQQARDIGLPVYRAVNMYRWCCDNWALDAEAGGSTAVWSQLSSDVSAAAAFNYQWPASGGNRLTPGTPPGIKATGIAASATSDASQDAGGPGFEPDKAFDGVASSKWSSRDLGEGASHWLVADLGVQKPINGYIVRHASSTGLDATTRNTVGFLIETSNVSPTGPWTLQTMARNNTPGVDGAAVSQFTYDTPVAARYVRLFINDSGRLTTGSRARIAELEIYTESVATASDWQMF